MLLDGAATVVSEASGTCLKASVISASVKPFFWRKDCFDSVDEPRTCKHMGDFHLLTSATRLSSCIRLVKVIALGCDKNATAF